MQFSQNENQTQWLVSEHCLPWLTYAGGCNLPDAITQRNVTFCVKLFEAASLSSACTRLQIPGFYPVWHVMWGCVGWVSASIQDVSYNKCVPASWGTCCSSGMRSSNPRSKCPGAASCWGKGDDQERRESVFHVDKQPDSGGNTKEAWQRKSSGLTEAFSQVLTVSQGGMTTEFCDGEKSLSCNSSSYSPAPSSATHTMWSDASWILEIHSSALKNMQMNEVNKEMKGPFSSIYYFSLLLLQNTLHFFSLSFLYVFPFAFLKKKICLI